MSLIDVSEIVDCLNTQPITFIVPSSGSYDNDGTYIPGGGETQIDDIPADIQPAGRKLFKVPEGMRISDFVEVFIASPNFMDTVNETTTTPEFKMVYRGTVWKVHDIPEDWRENGYINGLFVNTKKVFTP